MGNLRASSRLTFVESTPSERLESFAEAVESGLNARPKQLPCRFLYDQLGSELFEEICELPEYYLTRAEREILVDHADEIAAHFEDRVTLAELGSGSAAKTRLLIEALLRRHGKLRYVPVDISRSALEISARELLEDYQALEVFAIAAEYHDGLRHVRRETTRPKLVVWLGSNVGNFERDDAKRFVGKIRAAMAPFDRLLLGIDLRKDRETLERAYDDADGVTARFNMNLLARINVELGGRFDPAFFAHRATYHEDQGRVEIGLVSLRDQEIEIEKLGQTVKFVEGETIHTEDSYKYSLEEIEALARAARLTPEKCWLDRGSRFSLSLLAPL